MRWCNKFLLYFKLFKPYRIINALSIYRKDGWDGIKYHFGLVLDKEKGLRESGTRTYDMLPICNYEAIRLADPIVFENNINPIVSVIVPVYNKFEYTYNCLLALKKYLGNITYEIIVADDCSTDMTSEIETVVKGIRVIHNKKNFQFLVNCNSAAKEAKGKYIYFLNNDTQIQKGCVESLVKLLEANSKIGLIGSKLIYPTGLVQEAGGIVWKDAAVLQFGNGRQTGEAELNYVRETDYISGASMMIRSDLWKLIGGFDKRFIPAYYEDVDLAFEVRKRGFSVIYQPESEVIHFEGVTESINADKKKLIEQNKMEFQNKWQDELHEFHYKSTEYLMYVKRMKQYRNLHY